MKNINNKKWLIIENITNNKMQSNVRNLLIHKYIKSIKRIFSKLIFSRDFVILANRFSHREFLRYQFMLIVLDRWLSWLTWHSSSRINLIAPKMTRNQRFPFLYGTYRRDRFTLLINEYISGGARGGVSVWCELHARVRGHGFPHRYLLAKDDNSPTY